MTKSWWPDVSTRSEFLAPSLIAAGRGSSGEIGALVRNRFGLASGVVLVAVDDVLMGNGTVGPLLESLVRAGFQAEVVSGFGSEPSDTVIDAAASKARAANARVVVGIGGGSVLDSAKLISLLIRNPGNAADWIGVVEPPSGAAPLLLVPTTSGTGSEATRIAMVTVDGVKRASSCSLYVPSVVVIDPDLLASLPGRVLASTAMDALAHAVESLHSTTATPMTAHQSLHAIEILIDRIEDAVAGDPDARGLCLWASHLAGQALNAGVVVGHSLAYCLAHEHPMPHGTSCALALPYCIAYNRDLPAGLASRLASALTQGRSTSLRDAAEAVLELARRLDLPTTLSEAQIAVGREREIAARCVAEYPRPTNPVKLDEDRLTRLVTAMRTGDLDAAFAA